MIGISSCLLGINCTYSGHHHLVKGLKTLYDEGQVVEVCPEVLGGLTTPRDPAEIVCFDPLKIETNQHQDVTFEYVHGAKKALEILKENNVDVVMAKYRSPSCGNDGIYDGTFTHHLIEGKGVFVQMLEDNGIKVFNENQIEEFLKYIRKEDNYGTYFKD